MTLVWRILDPVPCFTLEQYTAQGGGLALAESQRLGPDGIIAEITTAGLRGRGGGGFPTGVKWRTVADSRSRTSSTSVVVNGAEGEPGTLKDRAILRCNPYKVIEGALIAAVAVGANEVVLALKGSFEREVEHADRALEEVERAGWAPQVNMRIVEGPSSYLFGEETALLEVVDGRQPFPRIDPPFRRGVDHDGADIGHSASRVHLAAVGGTDAAPALVNNVETMASVPGIVGHGAAWYRSLGTHASPGTILCTITGHTRRHAVGEVPMGTTLRDALQLIGGGPHPTREILGVLSGVANPVIPESLLDTPLTFEDMDRVGTGLGAGGFIAFQDGTDMRTVAHGAARFLATESCGQCEPCKRDGLAIAGHLAPGSSASAAVDVRDLQQRLGTVADGARCSLASQQQRVVGSMLSLFGDQFTGSGEAGTDASTLLLPLVDIVDGRAVLDTSFLSKQPDWSHEPHDSGAWPAALLGNQAVEVGAPRVREVRSAGRMGAVARPPDLETGPFPVLIGIHQELEHLLSLLREADPEARPDALRKLGAQLRVHIDVTQRVLYPMVQRVAGAGGDDASWAAEHAERDGLRIVDLLSNAPADAATDELIHELAEDLRAHLEAEQRHVIPLLVAHMSAEQLESLADALERARQGTN